MTDWFTWTQIIVSCGVGVLCLVLGLVGRAPSDLTLGCLALVELLLVAQIVVTVVVWNTGPGPTGSGVEFVGYLVTALIIPPAAVFWGFIERTKWSNVVLAIAALTIAVMIWRMDQIWFLQGATGLAPTALGVG